MMILHCHSRPVTSAELKRTRTRLGLTQVQLAAQLGVTALAVSFWERGTRKIGGPVARLVMLLGQSAASTRKGRR